MYYSQTPRVAGEEHQNDSGDRPWNEVKKMEKKLLIKSNITGYVDAPSGEVQASEAFLHVTIAKKNAPDRSKLEFVRIVRPEVGPTGTIEDSKIEVVRLGAEEAVNWGII
jgi:hypothetical protein